MSSRAYMFTAICCILLLQACTPTGGTLAPPADQTVEANTMVNYINKSYFALLGRKPTEAESNEALVLLKAANMSVESRRQFLAPLFEDENYYLKLVAEARNDYLNGTAPADMDAKNREIYSWIIDGKTDTLMADGLRVGIRNYQNLLLASADLASGKIDIAGLHRRCVTNYTYTEINMGTDNFIKSSFLNFLFRYPTQYELDQATLMVDGGSGTLFMKKGTGKDGYLDILFSSDNYYEGFIINQYRKYLLRKPSPTEIAELLALFKKDHNYQKVQEVILSSDEFAGLESHES